MVMAELSPVLLVIQAIQIHIPAMAVMNILRVILAQNISRKAFLISRTACNVMPLAMKEMAAVMINRL